MPFEVEPPVTEEEAEALRSALARVGLDLGSPSRSDAGAWRRAGARESVGLEPAEWPELAESPADFPSAT